MRVLESQALLDTTDARCVLSWLVSHSHYGLAQDCGISPVEVMDKLVDIVRKMKQELETGEKKTAETRV